MPRPHIPDLAAIEALPNQQIRFYAIVGAVISLTAGLEMALLDVFVKGLNIRRDTASVLLFKAKNSSLQRDMATAAMTDRLGSGPLVPAWDRLCQRIITATGQSGPRHLLAHNVVSTRTFGGSGMLGFGVLGEGPLGDPGEERFLVFQDHQKVLAGIHKAREADFDSLLAFCRELITLLTDLDDFLLQIP